MGRVKGGGLDNIGNSLHQSMCMPHRLRWWGGSAQAKGGEKPLACLGEIGHFLCRLLVARHLLCGLRVSGAKCKVLPLAQSIGGRDRLQQSSQKPEGGVVYHQWGACEWAPAVTPVTSRVGKKEKKRALQPSTIGYCSHSPGNTSILQLPLPKGLGGTQTLVTVPSQDPTTRSNWCSTICMD